MIIKTIAAATLATLVTACSSSGDTTALLVETVQACSTACTDYPDVESFSYAAGGGSPLLFSGRIAAECDCAGSER